LAIDRTGTKIMATWILAKKDLRVLVRDPRAAVVLIVMPFVYIFALGLLLGEGFGQKPDDRLRISVLNQDQGHIRPTDFLEPAACLAATPGTADEAHAFGALSLAHTNRARRFPPGTWAEEILKDLAHTAGIRIELVESEDGARQLIRERKRAAILVLGPQFSARVDRCSFLKGGINPFFRDGVNVGGADTSQRGPLDTWMPRDDTQKTAAGIIDQVVQVSLLRVILPWMIGRAFEQIGEPEFLALLTEERELPLDVKAWLITASRGQKRDLGTGLRAALQDLYPDYNLTAKTWASLTRSRPHQGAGAEALVYHDEGGVGVLNRGAALYQFLIPMSAVAFAFFLVLSVGWLFTAERRQGTLRRLQAAPLSRTDILFGKLLPCLLISVAQGVFLLGAGKLVFGMSWGPEPWLLLPVVLTTSLAAMGLALLVASIARTETQVAIYGTPLVLALALMGGCLIPPNLMPESVQPYTYLTPHRFALDAYTELLASGTPNDLRVLQACAVLAAFGVGFLAIAWWALRLE
jgi:ABC-type transport system involved in multi-copper enzyme maturation permease subunit